LNFLNEYERLFYQALRIRLVEERIAEIYPTDKIQSPVHLSIGQEHISVGICFGLRKDDLVFGTYRGHALYLAKGGCLKKMFAELFGKTSGFGQGKAGSMHFSAHEVGMMGSSAVVASTIPHAVGAALAAKVRKTKQVITCFFGEGATGEGVYHESLNFASKHQLPVLFVCENNDLSIYTKTHEVHAFSLVEHAEVYGISSQTIDKGWDLELIASEGNDCIQAIRSGSGPRLMEIKTYRYRQHVGPNEDYDLGYRTRDDLNNWQDRDPLIQDAMLVNKFRKLIENEIQEALEFAENSDFPTKENLFSDIK
jgi:TPP-dependent pyruvate/acetoin dehydrogenase alpha subunit